MGLEQIGLQAILDDKNFQDGLKRYTSGIGTMSSATEKGAGAITRLGSVMQGALTVGVGAAVTAIGAFTAATKIGLDATMQWGEQLDKLGDMFGMTGEQASKWAVAFGHVGVPVEEGAQQLNYFTRQLDDVKNAMAQAPKEFVTKKTPEQIKALNERLADAQVKLQRTQKALSEAKKPTDAMRYAVDDARKAIQRLNGDIGEASEKVPKKMKGATKEATPFQKALEKLGVAAFNSKGKLKTFDEIMPQIMDAFSKLPKGVNSSALAMDLFGARGGSKFLDFLRQGNKGLQDAKKFAQEFGLEMSTDTVDATEELGFATNDLKMGFQGLWNQIGVHVLPYARKLVDFILNKILPAFSRWEKAALPGIMAKLEQFGNWIGQNIIPALGRLSDAFSKGGLGGLADQLGVELGHVKDALDKWRNNPENIKRLQALGQWISDRLGEGVMLVLRGATWFADALSEVFKQTRASIKDAKVQTEGQTTADTFIEAFAKLLGSAINASLELLALMGTVAGKFLEWISTDSGQQQIGDIANKFIDALETALGDRASNIDWIGILTGGKSSARHKNALAAATDEWMAAGVVPGMSTFAALEASAKAIEEKWKAAGVSSAEEYATYLNQTLKTDTPLTREQIMQLIDTATYQATPQVQSSGRNTGTNLTDGISMGIVRGKPTVANAATGSINGALGTAAASAYATANTVGQNLDTSMANGIYARANAIIQAIKYIMSLGLEGSSTVPSFQTGGVMPHTGLAFLHKGETVIPASSVNNSTTNIYNFRHTWPSSVPSGERQWTEDMVRRVTHQEITTIFREA